jgi:branched-chain amino acid transport system permease protein
MLICAILGVVIERLAYKPLRNSTRIAVLITAIGVSLFLEYFTMFIVGPRPKAFPSILSSVKHKFFNGSVYVTNQQIVIFIVTIILMVLLQYIVYRTKIGKAMRAVSFDQDAALLMGINPNTTISATFAIGSAMAGAAGVLVGIYYTSIGPLMGIVPGLKALVAAVLGGIGSIPGAAVGGLLLGLIEAMVTGYWSSTFRDAVAFGILILILIIKPSGIFGSNVREKV